MVYSEDRDQWLSDGICSKCRRQKFCSKPCKRHKGTVQREVAGMMSDAIVHAILRSSKRKR